MIYFGYFSLSIILSELQRQMRLYNFMVPLKTIPELRPEWSKSIPVSRPKQLKNHTLLAALTYIAYVGEYPPPPPDLLFQASHKL